MRAYPVVLLGLAVALGGLGAPVHAGCAGPELQAVQEGGELVITGGGFHAGCADAFSCSGLPGCQRCTADETQTPHEDVRLELRAAGRAVPLGEVDATGTRGLLTLRVAVPAGVSGDAVVAADSPSGEATARVALR